MRISDWSSDVCSSDIDRTVSEGLGMRWSFMGPFKTIDLNAPGGVADYAERLGPLYHSIAMDRRQDRKSVVKGTSVSVSVDLGGRGIIKKNKSEAKSD